jgi:hypothetical protein
MSFNACTLVLVISQMLNKTKAFPITFQFYSIHACFDEFRVIFRHSNYNRTEFLRVLRVF